MNTSQPQQLKSGSYGFRKLTWLVGGLAIVAVGGAIVWMSLPDPSERNTSPQLPENVSIEARFGEIIPTDLQLMDEQGQPVQLGDLLTDKPVILNLVYFECPMLCNLTMDGLIRGLRVLEPRVGEDFTVLTVSFDPREGPKLANKAKRTALSRYGRQESDTGWHFLTGEETATRSLADAVGFGYEYDEKSAQYAHAAGIFVLSPEGQICRFLGGVEFAPRDLQLALAEASQGEVRSLADNILLLCFHYDPANGKYGLAILRLLRFGGALTVGALVAGIWIMNRQASAGREAAH